MHDGHAFRMSRLLSDLRVADLRRLAEFAVLYGVLVQPDAADASRRIVLPLHLEMLQAMLCRLLADTHAQVQPRSHSLPSTRALR